MKGFSLVELLIVIVLISATTLISFMSFTEFYEKQALQTFLAELNAALKLGQAISLTRNENLMICALKQGKCQSDWQGHLVLQAADAKLIHNFGLTPSNLMIRYQGFLSNDYILIKDHGLLINNGSFAISFTQYQGLPISALITLSKEGVLTVNEHPK